MTEYNRAQLKQAVRQSMRFQRPHPMLITLLFTIIVNAGSQMISQILGAASGSSSLSAMYYEGVLRYEDPEAAIQYVLLSFGPQRLALALFVGVLISGIIVSLWSGLMQTGYAGFCLNMVRGRQPQTGALFSAFPRWVGVLGTQFLAGLFRSLWALLLGAGLLVILFVSALLFAQPEVFLLILLCAYIAFFLGLMWVTLRYALVDYLIADQGLTGMDAIRESNRLMQGNTGRLFTLRLSFIGWYLLEAAIVLVITVIGLVAFGAGLSELSDALLIIAGAALGIFALIAVASIVIGILNLWLTPYITGAEALFYDWARGVNSVPNQGWGMGSGWGQSQFPDQPQRFDYNRIPPGPNAGTGIGSGSNWNGENGAPPRQPPKSPKPPRDDPWD